MFFFKVVILKFNLFKKKNVLCQINKNYLQHVVQVLITITAIFPSAIETVE